MKPTSRYSLLLAVMALASWLAGCCWVCKNSGAKASDTLAPATSKP